MLTEIYETKVDSDVNITVDGWSDDQNGENVLLDWYNNDNNKLVIEHRVSSVVISYERIYRYGDVHSFYRCFRVPVFSIGRLEACVFSGQRSCHRDWTAGTSNENAESRYLFSSSEIYGLIWTLPKQRGYWGSSALLKSACWTRGWW